MSKLSSPTRDKAIWAACLLALTGWLVTFSVLLLAQDGSHRGKARNCQGCRFINIHTHTRMFLSNTTPSSFPHNDYAFTLSREDCWCLFNKRSSRKINSHTSQRTNVQRFALKKLLVRDRPEGSVFVPTSSFATYMAKRQIYFILSFSTHASIGVFYDETATRDILIGYFTKTVCPDNATTRRPSFVMGRKRKLFIKLAQVWTNYHTSLEWLGKHHQPAAPQRMERANKWAALSLFWLLCSLLAIIYQPLGISQTDEGPVVRGNRRRVSWAGAQNLICLSHPVTFARLVESARTVLVCVTTPHHNAIMCLTVCTHSESSHPSFYWSERVRQHITRVWGQWRRVLLISQITAPCAIDPHA